MEENRKPKTVLTDQERFPLIKDVSFLNTLRQDALAPKFSFQSGDRLNAQHIELLKSYRKQIANIEPIHESGIPEWLHSFLESCIKNVPFYKDRLNDFNLNPTIRKDIVREEPWNFVSFEANIEELLVYHTSGTTGPPMDVNFGPVTQASWIPQMESVLDTFGVQFSCDRNKVAIALISDQLSTITYASLSTYLNGSGVLKINLHPSNWNNEEDRIHYIEKYNPEVLTGDPFSFLSLKKIKPNIQPKVLISSAMTLTSSVQKDLEAYFNCPVIDVYSLTEFRNIAFKKGDVFEVLRPDVYLEIFDPIQDKILPNGSYGEIVISGGNNPFLPLIRYRTGDFGKLKLKDGKQCIYDLEVREPVIFSTKSGKDLNNIDVSRAMVDVPIVSFRLVQNQDNSIKFIGWSYEDIQYRVKKILESLFEMKSNISIQIETPNSMEKNKKHIQYDRSY